MKNEYAQWRKLDNAALAFPAVTGKNDTRVFRFYCELKEEIKEETLQEALERTLEKYPLFRAVLRKGLFWFYLERRDIHAIVKKEKRPPRSPEGRAIMAQGFQAEREDRWKARLFLQYSKRFRQAAEDIFLHMQ